MVLVWTNSATQDLMLIQQNKFFWISNRSGVAELIQTVTKRTDWKFRCVVWKFAVGIEKVNHDAIETSSKNLTVSLKCLTRSTSNTIAFLNHYCSVDPPRCKLHHCERPSTKGSYPTGAQSRSESCHTPKLGPSTWENLMALSICQLISVK